MMIVYELGGSPFANMNSFAQSDFVLPHPMNDIASSLPPFGQQLGKFGGPHSGACRNGLSTTNSHSVTRKKHSKEVEYERKSSQCHIQEQESHRYKITNLLHQVNASKKIVDSDDVVRHSEETTETKIFIMEKRTDSSSSSSGGSGLVGRSLMPPKIVRMLWNGLKKLVGKSVAAERESVKFSPKMAAATTASKIAAEEASGGGSGGSNSSNRNRSNGSGNNPKMVGLVLEEEVEENKPLEEIALNGGGAVDRCANGGAQMATLKKKRNFFKKLASKGKRHALSEDRRGNIFEPIQSVSDIVNEVHAKNRIFQLMDAENKSAIYQLPQVECNTASKPAAPGPRSDQNTVKKFFIMKFILAKKKPSHTST